MATMYNPTHPGRILRQYLGTASGRGAAVRIARTTLSRVLNGKAGISADMALRVAEATEPRPRFGWTCRRSSILWQASPKEEGEDSAICARATRAGDGELVGFGRIGRVRRCRGLCAQSSWGKRIASSQIG